MDISIQNKNCNFKAKAVGLLCVKNKLLLVQMSDAGFFALPGGHIHIGESATDAVVREMKEEALLDVKIKAPLCIIENFFDGKMGKCHEITFCYIVQLLNESNFKMEDFVRHDIEDGKLDFRWFSIDELHNVDLKPTILKEKILALNKHFELLISTKPYHGTM